MTGKLIPMIAAATGMPIRSIERLIERSPYTYKVYQIEKRTGGKRTIAQPARETKVIQHWLIENVFSKLPIHACATAYQLETSIKKNAELHKDCKYLVKLDFRNFFPSITHSDLCELFGRHFGNEFDQNDISLMATVVSFEGNGANSIGLSIGAPSSPCLANAMMFEFDKIISEWCNANDFKYSRYADDLALSTNLDGASDKVLPVVRRALEQLEFPRLALNESKTKHLSKKHRRRVTGLILNNEGNISLGRARKREISSLIHKMSCGELPDAEIGRLQGLLGFARDIEPLFVLSMDRKYGNELLDRIFRHRVRHKDNDAKAILERLLNAKGEARK